MKRVKVMHVILDMGPGGAERVVLNYMKDMDRSRFVPILCVLGRVYEKESMEVKETGVKFFYLHKKLGWDVQALLKLSSIIKNNRVDILHLHNISAIAYGTLAALISTRPIIFRTEHNVIIKAENLINRIKPKMRMLMSLFHTKIITVSDEVKKSIVKQDPLFRNKYITIHNGIELSAYNSMGDIQKYRQEFGLREDNIVIGKVASMYPQKAHEIFLETAKIVLNNIAKARFLIIGNGPRRSELEKMVSNMGIEKEIIFTGVRNDVPCLLQFMDIFALSSAWEGFPITILEAMASGTPVVVTDVGGNREAVVNGETGYLVKKGDPQALADAIIELATDQNKRAAMGRAGKIRLLNNFTSEIMVRTTENEYLKALHL